jgi:deazaflavin-dependent oxidoreductase (nitroreductase family)
MRTDTVLGRTVQKVASSRLFATWGPKLAPTMDRVVFRLSRGRFMVSRGMLPMVMLTATGAKSGLPRTTPLATFPLDGDLIVVGSNFGQATHPSWSANLIAHPDARVSFEGDDFAVTAHLLDHDEKAEVWPRLTSIWPLFDSYADRSGRDLRVFRLVRT